MSEEFKPIRITLSDEAYARMEYITELAKFRSASSTIEECIRAVYDIIKEIEVVGGKIGEPTRTINIEDERESWSRIIMRMFRFTGRHIVPRAQQSK